MGLATGVDVEKVAGDAKRAVNTESVRCQEKTDGEE